MNLNGNNGYEGYSIKDMPSGQRPMERLVSCGVGALSNAELLAVVIRCGTKGQNVIELATMILNSNRSLRNLACMTHDDLSKVRGMGNVRAAQVIAAIELGRRIMSEDREERTKVSCPEDAVRILMPQMRYLLQEEFWVILLDTRSQVIKIEMISVGILNSSIIHPREVFKEAIKSSAASVILAHNHPSGDPTPSAEDLDVTQRIVEAGRLIGIEVIDHIVIGDNVYTSIKRFNMKN